MVRTRGRRLGRSSLPLQLHHAHRAAALPRPGSPTLGTRRQVGSVSVLSMFHFLADIFIDVSHCLPVPLRVLLDRALTDYNNVFHGLDPEQLDLPPPLSPPPPPTTTSRSPAADRFAGTSETNTSDRSSPCNASRSPPSSTDLSHILLNIRSCRWRHFRPRTLPLHELDDAHPLFRKLSRDLKRPISSCAAGGRPFGSQRPARVVAAPPPVAGRWPKECTHARAAGAPVFPHRPLWS